MIQWKLADAATGDDEKRQSLDSSLRASWPRPKRPTKVTFCDAVDVVAVVDASSSTRWMERLEVAGRALRIRSSSQATVSVAELAAAAGGLDSSDPSWIEDDRALSAAEVPVGPPPASELGSGPSNDRPAHAHGSNVLKEQFSNEISMTF